MGAGTTIARRCETEGIDFVRLLFVTPSEVKRSHWDAFTEIAEWGLDRLKSVF